MIYLYTDGSCHHTDKLGTYGAVVSTPTTKKLLYGMVHETTISRMELMPMVEGMRWVLRNVYHGKPNGVLCLVSDSEYTIKVAGGINVTDKNVDLWVAFRELSRLFKIKYEWRSRNSCIPLEICDVVAGAMRTYAMSNIYKVMNLEGLQFEHES